MILFLTPLRWKSFNFQVEMSLLRYLKPKIILSVLQFFKKYSILKDDFKMNPKAVIFLNIKEISFWNMK